MTPRLGRDVGPSTPVAGVLLGEPFQAISPLRVLRADAEIGLTALPLRDGDPQPAPARRGRRAARVARRCHLRRPGRRAGVVLQQRGRVAARLGLGARGAGPATAGRWPRRSRRRGGPTSNTRSARRWRTCRCSCGSEPLATARARSPGARSRSRSTSRAGTRCSRPAPAATCRPAGEPRPAPAAALRRAVGPAPEHWAQDHQVHGTSVRVVAPDEPVRRDGRAESDGSATARRDVACVVRAADCVPVALVAPEAVAAIHGGWRGLAAGRRRGGRPRRCRALGASEIRAAIGPHARVCCYEAGEELHAAFAQLGPQVRSGRQRRPRGRRARAARAVGASTRSTPSAPARSARRPGLLWSHRRQGEQAGRQGALVWRS